MKRAVAYLRLSSADDASTSIAMQRANVERWCTAYGYELVDVLADDGISGRVARANLDEAIRRLRDGEADLLIVNSFDRVSRAGVGGIHALLDAVDSRPEARFVAVATGLDSEQPTWRLIAVVLAEIARAEVENIITRTKAGIAYKRTVERRFTGGSPPFGYRSVPHPSGAGRALEPYPPEVAIVEEFVERALRGESQYGMASELNRRGIPTTRSAARRAQHAGLPTDGLDAGTWQATTIREILVGDALRGFMKHDGKLLSENGVPLEVWPAIVDASTHARLRAALVGTGAPQQRRKRAARLLSGLVYCYECNAVAFVHTSNRATSYSCTGNNGPCPRPRMKAEHVERVVVEEYLEIFGRLEEVEIVELVDSSAIDADLAGTRFRIDATLEAMREPDADVASLASSLQSLKQHLAELEAAAPVTRVEARSTGRTVAEAWEAADDAEKRRTIARVLEYAAIKPHSGQRRGFHPERVEVVWRGGDAAEAL